MKGKIKRIEELKEVCKADITANHLQWSESRWRAMRWRLGGLRSALAILNEPSNTQMQPDKTPKCPVCDWSKENKIYDKYCGACGRAFDR